MEILCKIGAREGQSALGRLCKHIRSEMARRWIVTRVLTQKLPFQVLRRAMDRIRRRSCPYLGRSPRIPQGLLSPSAALNQINRRGTPGLTIHWLRCAWKKSRSSEFYVSERSPRIHYWGSSCILQPLSVAGGVISSPLNFLIGSSPRIFL